MVKRALQYTINVGSSLFILYTMITVHVKKDLKCGNEEDWQRLVARTKSLTTKAREKLMFKHQRHVLDHFPSEITGGSIQTYKENMIL